MRGGKVTDFEDGIRAVTVTNGGYLPKHRRGAQEPGITDWWSTFCALVNVDPRDTVAVDAGVPDIALISGTVDESPRTELIVLEYTLGTV